jgi:hypothetical protein
MSLVSPRRGQFCLDYLAQSHNGRSLDLRAIARIVRGAAELEGIH